MKRYFINAALSAVLLLINSACHRSSCEMWEDTKTCSRYVERGLRSLFGQHVDGGNYAPYEIAWDEKEPFIPMAGAQNFATPSLLELGSIAPKESPGDPGSPIPGIDKFSSPLGNLALIFQNVQFETDNYTVKGTDNVQKLRSVAEYLAKHPRTCVFIEGHADERGAAAYNFSLSSKRANAIRSFLIQNGAHPDQLFTVSYGKERPLASGHDEQSWQQNRRGQFKLYER